MEFYLDSEDIRRQWEFSYERNGRPFRVGQLLTDRRDMITFYSMWQHRAADNRPNATILNNDSLAGMTERMTWASDPDRMDMHLLIKYHLKPSRQFVIQDHFSETLTVSNILILRLPENLENAITLEEFCNSKQIINHLNLPKNRFYMPTVEV